MRICGEVMELTSSLQSTVTFAAMVTVECTDVGLSVISKAALNHGMNNVVAVVYYNALATLILLPYFLFRRYFYSFQLLQLLRSVTL